MLIPTLVLSFIAPAPTAKADIPQGIFTFNITDQDGNPIPARLSFFDSEENRNNLFPNPDADPKKLAVRNHAVYTLDGEGTITVPVGSWDIMASHGIEWSIDVTHIDVSEDGKYMWDAILVHEIDTTDWVCGDFHLHTLTHSGHGDSNMNERIISIVGEGVEFAVATDHNHNTDYQPTIDSVGANEHLTAVVGNEVSSSYGHLNAFPFDAQSKVVNQKLEAPELFALIRAENNPFGVVPIIQINHPRWGNIDYFGSRGLDPVTGKSDDNRWSWDFDSIEVLNENYGWGYHDAEITTVPTRSSRHSVLRDWYNMLNAGREVSAVGNSDSHTVIANIAGIPRNYVYVGYDDAGNINPKDITDGIRSGRMSTTTGPFMRMTVNGQPMGSTISISDSVADVHVDVQAASWIDLDTIKVIQNGDQVAEVTIENAGEGDTHLRPRIRIDIPRDCWVIAIAEGSEPMTPYVDDDDRQIFPVAIGNPVFIDADGDGKYTPPLEWAQNIISSGNLDTIVNTYEAVNPTEKSLLVMASSSDPELARKMILLGLTNQERIVRLAATKTAQAIKDHTLIPILTNVIDNPESDRYLAFSAWMAIDETAPEVGQEELLRFTDRFGWETAKRYTKERQLNLPGEFVREWQVAGYFAIANDSDRLSNLEHQKQIPEPNIVSLVVPRTTNGEPLAWVEMQSNKDGYLNLSLGKPTENTIAYARCWLWSPDERTVDFTIGSDDACRMWVNEELVFHDADWHRAKRDRKFGSCTLQEGWNPVLFKILNGLEGMGLYFRVLDDEIKSTGSAPKAK
ncbi:MAG: CehA/McbA family metallohydrolase [Planctomycetes bacterium]|nr:CehA/McbA family metallohydrolase [Planctomycetota bacterium]